MLRTTLYLVSWRQTGSMASPLIPSVFAQWVTIPVAVSLSLYVLINSLRSPLRTRYSSCRIQSFTGSLPHSHKQGMPLAVAWHTVTPSITRTPSKLTNGQVDDSLWSHQTCRTTSSCQAFAIRILPRSCTVSVFGHLLTITRRIKWM